MKAVQPQSITIRQIEFELEKAEHGMALPYDAERVGRAGGETGAGIAMTTLTLRLIKNDFIVTGPDIAPAKFKSRREAKDWCVQRYPGSPIKEIGADATKRLTRAMPRKGPLRRRGPRTVKIKTPVESGGVP